MGTNDILDPPSQRIDLAALLPGVYAAQLALTKAAHQAYDASGLPKPLRELILMRVSQINGCAFCLDMHSKDARHAGESEDRLYLLNAWRESPNYDRTERAALALAEAVTLVSVDHVPDDLWATVTSVLDEAQVAAVIAMTLEINGWNRICVTSRTPPGHYQPA